MTDFNFALMFALIIASVPGIVTLIPLLSKLLTSLEPRPGQKLPSLPVLRILAVGQTLVIVAIASAVGTALAQRVGLHAPAFEALVAGRATLDALLPQIAPALATATIGAALFVAAYYRIFRPRLGTEAIRITESFRMEVGLAGRLFYGGIVEEILTRWGVMSLLVWLLAALAGGPGPGVVWIAIVISGVLFALGHLPAVMAQGLRITRAVLATNLFLNLWASLIFGWLFWQYGLEAAMLAHMVFHAIWYPFEVRHHTAQKDMQDHSSIGI